MTDWNKSNSTSDQGQVLDFGCGNRKRPGSIGVDINPRSDADVIHDLNVFPYPFADDIFREILADNVIEHLDNLIGVMEELHRICRADGLIHINVPYFRAKWACIDPTHRHFFTVESFYYFDPTHIYHKLYKYSTRQFEVRKVLFNHGLQNRLPKQLLVKIANLCPHRYESYLSHLIPLDMLTFQLRPIK
jgi:predicted SAM-dependent methyltransferase